MPDSVIPWVNLTMNGALGVAVGALWIEFRWLRSRVNGGIMDIRARDCPHDHCPLSADGKMRRK